MKFSYSVFLLCGITLTAHGAETQVNSPAPAPVVATAAVNPKAQLAQAAELRKQASQQKSALAKDDEARRQACYKKILVNACLEEARQEQLRVHADIRKLELEANQLERQARAEERKARLAGAGDRAQRADEAVRRKSEHDEMVKEFQEGKVEAPPVNPEHAAHLQAAEAAQGTEKQRIQQGTQRASVAETQMQRHRAQMQLQPAKIQKVKEAERLLEAPAKAAPAAAQAVSSH